MVFDDFFSQRTNKEKRLNIARFSIEEYFEFLDVNDKENRRKTRRR